MPKVVADAVKNDLSPEWETLAEWAQQWWGGPLYRPEWEQLRQSANELLLVVEETLERGLSGVSPTQLSLWDDYPSWWRSPAPLVHLQWWLDWFSEAGLTDEESVDLKPFQDAVAAIRKAWKGNVPEHLRIATEKLKAGLQV
jgi:hypothetical protein